MKVILIIIAFLLSGYLQAQCVFDSLTLSRIKKLWVAEFAFNMAKGDKYLDCLEKHIQIKCSKIEAQGFENINFYSIQFLGGIPVSCYDSIYQYKYNQNIYIDIDNPSKYIFALDSKNGLLFKIAGFRSSELLCVIELYGRTQLSRTLESNRRIYKRYSIDGIDLKKGNNLTRCK